MNKSVCRLKFVVTSMSLKLRASKHKPWQVRAWRRPNASRTSRPQSDVHMASEPENENDNEHHA
jgi:hypothetical protein